MSRATNASLRVPDLQARRAANPGPRSASRGPYQPKAHGNVVAPMPADNATFSWELVAARQCVSGEKYTVPDECEERDHFTKYAANVLGCVKDGTAHKTELMQKISEVVASLNSGDQEAYLKEFMRLKYIEYAQLKKQIYLPNLTGRAPPADDPEYQPVEMFESFDVVETVTARYAKPKTVIKKMVQAPASQGGWYAEVASTRGLMYKVALEFDVTFDEDFNVAFNVATDATCFWR